MGPVLLRPLGPQPIDAFSAEAAFLSAGGYHHYIGLPLGRVKSLRRAAELGRLYHLAIGYRTRAELADAL